MSSVKIDHHELYGRTPPVRLFFRAAIPGVIGMFAMSIYSIVEGIFVGQFIGGDAFAAINLAMPLVMINYSVADMIGVGSSVPISIALGKKKEEQANNIFSCAVLLILAAAVLFGAVMFVLGPLLLQAMGAEPEVLRLAAIYLRINAAMGPVATLVFAMDNFLRISGYVRVSMVLNILMSGLQVCLLVLFVVVMKLGLVGSSLAINLGMTVCTGIALIPFLRKRTVLKFRRPRFSTHLVKEIIACGSPTFLANTAGRVFSLLMNYLLLRMGGTMAMSAYSVVMYSSDLVQPFLYGLCDSLQPAIGYNWGNRAYSRVKQLVKCIFVSTAVISAMAIIIFLTLSGQISSMFVDSAETELLALSSHALKLFSLKFFFWWLAYAAQSFYNAIERPKNAAILTLSAAIVVPLIMVGILWPLGLDGLFLNQSLTFLPVAVMAVLMLKKTGGELGERKEITNGGTRS